MLVSILKNKKLLPAIIALTVVLGVLIPVSLRVGLVKSQSNPVALEQNPAIQADVQVAWPSGEKIVVDFSPSVVYAQYTPGTMPYSTPGAAGPATIAYNQQGAASAGTSGNNETQKILGNILGWIFYFISACLGWLVSLAVSAMVAIAAFPIVLGNFQAIVTGWGKIRDLCNNFFIVMLLIISLGTIMRLPGYHYKQTLPKLLIMAILINFSFMFTGIMIDVSQVIMLTFASAIQGVGPNIILDAIGLPKLFALKGNVGTLIAQNNAQSEIGILNILVAMIFAIIASAVALVVIVITCIILIYRIVMLLFLAVLSPLPYLLSAFPKTASYGSQWWSEITKYLVVGPVMLFFIWLAVSLMIPINKDGTVVQDMSGGTSNSMTGAGITSGLMPDKTYEANGIGKQSLTNDPTLQTLSQALSIKGIINFMLVIGLMVAALVMGQKFGGAAAGIAGKGVGFLSSQGKKWSGISGVQDTFKAYQGMRKNNRDQKVRRNADLLYRGEQGLKKGAAKVATTLARPVKSQWERFGGRTADQLQKDVKARSEGIEQGEATLVAEKDKAGKSKVALTEAEKELAARKQKAASHGDRANLLSQFQAHESDIGAGRSFNVGDSTFRKVGANWEKVNTATSQTEKSGIREEDLFTESTGITDDFEVKRRQAEAEMAKRKKEGKTGKELEGIHFEHGGVRYYKRADNDNWSLVDNVTGNPIAGKDNRANLDIRGDAGLASTSSDQALNDLMVEHATSSSDIAAQEAVVQASRQAYYDDSNEVMGSEAAIASAKQQNVIDNQRILQAQKRQRTADFVGKGLVVAAGAGLGVVNPATIGVLGSALVGTGAGLGILSAGRAIGDASRIDLNRSNTYQANQVNEKRKEVKDDSSEELQAKSNDRTLDAFTRIAATLEAMRKGLYGLEEARHKRDQIIAETAGWRGKPDHNIGVMLNAALESKYKMLAPKYAGIETGDPKAVKKLRDDIKDGDVLMKELDTDSLTRAIAHFAESYKVGRFTGDWKALPEAKKQAVIDALTAQVKAGATGKVQEMLAHIKDIPTAFERAAPAAIQAFVKKIDDADDLTKLLNKAENTNALRAALGGDKSHLAQSIQIEIEAGSPRGRRIAKSLGIPTTKGSDED
ncbi:MAG: hypothetical protein WC516_00265 [Patescibacteria group bacterium]